MRARVTALAVAFGLGSAGAAAAQTMGMGQSAMAAHAQTGPDDPFALGQAESPKARYALELSMLRKKMLRMTQEDGGQLSAPHQAALQRELDAINKAYAANAPAKGARR